MKEKGILQTLILLVFTILLISALSPFFTGSEKAMVVMSGSMVPLMLPGDMIIVESISPDKLTAGDIIAFKDPGGKDTFVTHRIIKIKEGNKLVFKTKGDANEEEDLFEVPALDVVGKLVFVIPFAGYLPKASQDKNFFFFTVIFPACLIIINEIREIIAYSNPSNARKIERKKKKISRNVSHSIIRKNLISVSMVGFLVFSGILMYNIGENGPVNILKEGKVENSGFLSSFYVFLPADSEQEFSIEPEYAIITPKNETYLYGLDTPVYICSVPYILPAFWIISLAKMNPYLPITVEVLVYTMILSVFLFPLWYRKIIRGKRIRKIKLRHLLVNWKRKLHSNCTSKFF